MRLVIDTLTNEITEAPLEGDEAPTTVEFESVARIRRALADGRLDLGSIIPTKDEPAA
jgi:hypothetical protein